MTELHNILIKDDGNRITLIFSKTVSDITRARKLLDLFEEDISKPEISKVDLTREKISKAGLSLKEPKTLQSSSVENKGSNPASGRIDNAQIVPLNDDKGRAMSGESKLDTHDNFIFKECEPFKWFELPTFRAGKTMYHLCQGKVHIMREGYSNVQIYATLRDLECLHEHPEIVKGNLEGFYKRYVLKGFLRDVDFAKIGHRPDEPQPSNDMSLNDDAKQPDKPGTIIFDGYKSRKDRVQEGLNEGLSEMAIAAKYKIPIREVESIANILRNNGDGA